MPFGIASAPSIFQRTIESILQGIPKVCVYIDDILVTGRTEDEHLKNLREVLERLETSGFRLKRAKCLFFLKSIDYLGHTISPDGLSPNEKKVQAIRAAPRPVDVGQLRSFLGLVNYYGKFLPNLASTLAPLYLLLHKHTDWRWGIDQSRAFEQAKGLLTSCLLLVHFDPDKELLVSCDASPYGLGAVLSHRMEDGSSKPIYYASRTLSAPEREYSQLDKEGLAIICCGQEVPHIPVWASFYNKFRSQAIAVYFGPQKSCANVGLSQTTEVGVIARSLRLQVRVHERLPASAC